MGKEKVNKFIINETPAHTLCIDMRKEEDKKEIFKQYRDVILIHLRPQCVFERNDHDEDVTVVRPLGSVVGSETEIGMYSDIDTNFYSICCTVRRSENTKIVKAALRTSINILLDEFIKYKKDAAKLMNTMLFINASELDNLVLYEYAPDDIAQDIIDVVTSKFGADSISVIIGVDNSMIPRNRIFEFDYDKDDDKKKKNKKKKNKKKKK